MCSGRLAERALTWLGWAILGATAVLVYGRLYLSVCFTDEAFYVALPYSFLIGLRPLIDEVSIYQLAALLLVPPVDAYLGIVGSSTGLVLFMRHLYFAASLICAGLVARTFWSRIGAGPALLIAACGLAYVPFHIPSLSYNTMAGLGLLGGTMALMHAPGARRPALDVFVGVSLLAWGSFGYPTLALVTLPATIAMLWLLAHFGSSDSLPSAVLAAVLAAGLMLAFGLALVATHGGLESVQRLIDFNRAIAAQGGGLDKLGRVGDLMVADHRYLLAAGALLALGTTAVASRRAHWLGILAAAATGPALHFAARLHFGITAPRSTTPYVLALLALGTVMMAAMRRPRGWRDGDAAALRTVALVSLLAGIVILWSSANGPRNAAQGLLPAALIGLAWTCGPRPSDGTGQRAGARATRFAVLMISLIGFQLVSLYTHVYHDTPMRSLTARIDEGPWAGIYTGALRRDFLRTLTADLEGARGPETRTILFLDYFPGGYLLSNLRPRTPHLWMFPGAPYHQGGRAIRDFYLDSFEGSGPQPDLVFVMKQVPIVKRMKIRPRRADPLRLHFQGDDFPLVVERPDYEIRRYVPAAPRERGSEIEEAS